MQLFAYPTNRRFPWCTVLMLASTGGVTMIASLYWKLYMSKADDLEELQQELLIFTKAVEACGVTRDAVEGGQVHQLLLSSLFRAGDQPFRTMADVLTLGCCGTLLERLYGS